MAQGIRGLQKVQLGREATAGSTSTVATTIWRGVGGLQDNREVVFVEENIGILGNALRSHIPMTGGEIELEADASFEQLPHVFDAGIYKTTAVQDGVGTGYIYEYNMQSVSTDPVATTDLQTYLIEGGDNNEVETMRYGFVTEFTLSGATGESMNVTAKFQGREIEGGQAFTAAVAIPTVETILFSKAKLYIDATSDTIGTTLVSQTLLDADLSVTTGWQAVVAADGRLDFSFIKRVSDEITCDLTYEHNATATTEKAAWRNQTERAIRLVIEGTALGTAGTVYTYKTLIIDMYGKYESFDSLDETDGNNTVACTFRVGYSATAAKKLAIVVVNELTAMP